MAELNIKKTIDRKLANRCLYNSVNQKQQQNKN